MKRKSIRKKVQEVLKAANITNVGQDIFCRKSSVHEGNDLPIICIYSNSESSRRFDQAPKTYDRSLEVSIELISSHDTDEELCDELDDLADEIEDAMELSPELQGWKPIDNEGNCTEDAELTSTDYTIESDGSSPMGSVRLTYAISYIKNPAIKKAHNDLKTLEIGWEIGDHQENKAIDNVTLP